MLRCVQGKQGHVDFLKLLSKVIARSVTMTYPYDGRKEFIGAHTDESESSKISIPRYGPLINTSMPARNWINVFDVMLRLDDDKTKWSELFEESEKPACVDRAPAWRGDVEYAKGRSHCLRCRRRDWHNADVR